MSDPRDDGNPLKVIHLSAAREIVDARQQLEQARHNAQRRYGRALVSRRRAKGISQRALARAAGISAAFLCDLEHGRRFATHDVACEIHDAMGE